MLLKVDSLAMMRIVKHACEVALSNASSPASLIVQDLGSNADGKDKQANQKSTARYTASILPRLSALGADANVVGFYCSTVHGQHCATPGFIETLISMQISSPAVTNPKTHKTTTATISNTVSDTGKHLYCPGIVSNLGPFPHHGIGSNHEAIQDMIGFDSSLDDQIQLLVDGVSCSWYVISTITTGTVCIAEIYSYNFHKPQPEDLIHLHHYPRCRSPVSECWYQVSSAKLPPLFHFYEAPSHNSRCALLVKVPYSHPPTQPPPDHPPNNLHA
ncbi:hypothetical protein PSTG_07602 [Puccinia striiformis f. sp. tritici PST-78]|uniref:Uncharacterized protein n=1 Tax=Puccinia striiformis f. sp. tritici PST-78 TaxID=1165861 RepID=A0A0L0VIN5_9BASI|nr:hypothetical protein PSTG_07602 [Puccinia striiformis f. sp. tritici PST-78]